jgi:hypothetical protein
MNFEIVVDSKNISIKKIIKQTVLLRIELNWIEDYTFLNLLQQFAVSISSFLHTVHTNRVFLDRFPS